MNEILEHGPVTAGFNVYSDWIHYRSGTGWVAALAVVASPLPSLFTSAARA
jgi:hypothetical protein